MNYSLFFNTQEMYLTDDFLDFTSKKIDIKIILDDNININNYLESFTKKNNNILIYTPYIENTLAEIKNYFSLIIACGGVVYNEKEEILLIFRNGVWDLPKGKIDAGENYEECALREVREETGLNNINLLDFLGNTFHVYLHKEKYILKQSFWYKMKASKTEILIPQIEENIEKVSWVKKELAKELLGGSYPSFKNLIPLI